MLWLTVDNIYQNILLTGEKSDTISFIFFLFHSHNPFSLYHSNTVGSPNVHANTHSNTKQWPFLSPYEVPGSVWHALCTVLWNPQPLLLQSLYKWGNWGFENVIDFPKVTVTITGKSKLEHRWLSLKPGSMISSTGSHSYVAVLFYDSQCGWHLTWVLLDLL